MPRCKELVCEVLDDNWGSARRLALQFSRMKAMKDIMPARIQDASQGGSRRLKVNHYQNIKIIDILSFNVI